MTRRERLELKAEKRREWAAARAQNGEESRERVHQIADQIPFGQPILVGHHSERHARADQRRIENGMRSAVENWKMSDLHESKADGLERQLRTSVFSDDEDAIERLREKLARLETKQESMKAANSEYRKEHGKELRAMGAYDRSQAVPFPSYSITNNGAEIRRCKQRIVDIERTAAMVERGERGYGKSMSSRYAGTCPDCGEDFDRGASIVYYRVTREAVCASCAKDASTA